MTFGEAVEFLQEGKTGRELNKVKPTNGQRVFIQENPELWQKARETNYEIFSKIYVDKDQLLDDKKQDEDEERERGSKRDELIKHLFRLQEIIWLYQNGKYNEFLKITDFKKLIVFIILDNGGWPSYNFEYFFTQREDKESIVDRTKKLFYVCCTRAMENLAVYYHDPSDSVIERARELFGEENVVNLDE